MTREALISLSPERVIELAKSYFTETSSGYAGSLVDEGDGYARFQTFRGHLAVHATRDGDQTRVRCSTLQYHPAIGKFLLQLKTESPVAG